MTPKLRCSASGALLLLLCSASAGIGPARADSNLDVEVTNLLEFQVGRDPETEETDRTRFFDQLILDAYADGGLRFGLRLDRFEDSPPPTLFGAPTEEYEYDRVAQRFVEWSDGSTTVRLGNGYAIFGSGLVFRAFELPGVVRQTRFPLVAYAESRDLDGITAHSWRGPVEISVVHGRPVVAPDVAPEQSLQQRRAGSVSGANGRWSMIEGLSVGGSYLRTDGLEPGASTSKREEIGAVELSLEPLRWVGGWVPSQLSLRGSVEYAGRNWRPVDDGLSTNTGTPHALYSHTQIAWSSGALVIETKDYHRFRLALSDPPSLVPEFTHHLLNRTTHVLDPLDEKGHQLTLGQSLPSWLGGGSIEAIHARAKGRLEILDGFGRARLYEQTFVAVESDQRRSARLRVYFSDGRDEFDGLDEVRTFGVLGSWALPHGLAAEFDIAHQLRERPSPQGGVHSDDFAVQGSVSRASLGQIGFLWERTDDPLFLDDPFTPEVEAEPRHYLIGTVAWLLDDRHDVIVSYGRRRGGTACTSGTCYFVPDFEGLELRVQSRF